MTNQNSRHYIFNLISQYSLTIVSSVIGFVSAPIALNYWKVEQFGVWAIVTSLAAYLAISGLGVDVAAGILMTKNNDASVKKQIFRKSLIVVIITTFFFMFGILFINFIKPDWIKFFGKMNENLIPVAKVTSIIFILSFLINLPFGIVSNSFAAYGKAYINNVFNAILNVLIFISLLVIVYLKGNLVFYAILYGGVTLFVNIIKTIIYLYVAGNYINPESGINNSKDNTYRIIVITGVRLSLYGLAVMLSSNISNLIISNSLNVSSVTPYQLTYKLYFIAFTFLTAINLSAAPLYGREYANRNWEWLAGKYVTFFTISLLIGGAIWLGGMLFLEDIIYLWVGIQGYAGIWSVIFLGAWIFTSSLSNVNYVVVNSFNYTKGIALISWSEALVFIGSSILLIKPIGIAGVAAGLLTGSMLITQWALPYMIYIRSGKRLKYNFKLLFIIISTFVITIPASYYLHSYVANRPVRVMYGCIIFVLYLILCYKIIPKDLKSILQQRFKRDSQIEGNIL